MHGKRPKLIGFFILAMLSASAHADPLGGLNVGLMLAVFLAVIALAEAAIIVVEGVLYWRLLELGKFREGLAISFWANLCSAIFGTWIIASLGIHGVAWQVGIALALELPIVVLFAQNKKLPLLRSVIVAVGVNAMTVSALALGLSLL